MYLYSLRVHRVLLDMGLFTRKSDSYLGVDIGAGGIKIVELHKTKGRPQLWTYGVLDAAMDVHTGGDIQKTSPPSVSVPPAYSLPALGAVKKSAPQGLSPQATQRVEKYAAMLKALIHESKVRSRKATASLPVSHVFHAVVTLPKVDTKELEHHIRAKVKKMLPRPIEEMQVLHQVIPSPDAEAKHLRILVTAAPVELIRFYTAIFAKAGLELEELETEAFALERSLVGRDTSTVMVIDVGAERTNFFIIDQGIPLTHRTVQLGGNSVETVLQERLGVSADMMKQIKMDIARLPIEDIPIDIFTPVVDPIIKEIQYSFDLFLHQSGNEQKRPEKIILTGGSAVFPVFLRSIREAIPIKVFVGDPWARVVYQQGLKPVLDQIAPRMAVSIGLALRNIV